MWWDFCIQEPRDNKASKKKGSYYKNNSDKKWR